MKTKLLRFSTLTLAILFFSLTACDTTDNDDDMNGSARMTVQLTDAPANYDAVWIDIQEVRITTETDLDEESDSEDADEESDWITINNEPMQVDLLELRNGGTIQIGDEEVDAGMYNQIRLVLGPENSVVIDGETHTLTTPSAQQSGLKLNIDADVEAGEIYNLLVDFDAGRSIVETGSNKYILKPVLRAVELEETGTISGMVQPDTVQTSVMAVAGNDTLSTLSQDGTFSIIGVPAGNYDVIFESNSEVHSDTTVVDVNVDIDEDVDVGSITLPEL